MFQHLIDCLCLKYCELYIDCKGKHAYFDFQVRWHDFLRRVASAVDNQNTENAQIKDEEHKAIVSFPVGCAWLYLLSVVSIQVSRETQFTMLREIAKVV